MTVLTHAHGGDLDAIQRTYGIPKEEIIDFSGNINPLGFPKRAEDALKENLHLICTYPDKNIRHSSRQSAPIPAQTPPISS